MLSMKKAKNIIWFEDCSDEDYWQVGGKNAKIGRMIQLKIRVPPGFAVTTGAFDSFLDETGLREKILCMVSQISFEDNRYIVVVAPQIRELIEKTPIPKKIANEIKEAYRKLSDLCENPDLPVAVRSSATSEDLETASFAGQHESYLWIRNEEEVVRHVSKCWGSLFTNRAIAYRNKVKWPQDKVTISVGVQKMVNAKCAGVMFTIHPVSGDSGQMVIEGNWGLGESVVSGNVDVDMYMLSKEHLKIIDKKLGEKSIQVVPKGCGVVEEELPAEKRNAYALNEKEAVEIGKMGEFLESHFKQPQDLEWAIDDKIQFPDNIFLLQTRPVVGVKIQKPKTNEDKIIEQLLEKIF
jgi:pyruvate,water dikinase